MARVDVVMPRMGESITEGTVITWHKQVGDSVEVDETLLEIGTDKVDTEVPSPSAGKLAEIVVPEGDTVEVGTVIARIETDVDAERDEPPSGSSGDGAAEPAPVKEDRRQAEDGEPESAPAMSNGGPAGGSDGGAVTDVVMPKMGESIMEGTIIGWRKQVGDRVEADETLLEIATDKVDTEVPAPESGVLQEILVKDGETVDVGTVIGRIATGAGADASAGSPSPTPTEERDQKPAERASAKPARPSGPAQQTPSGDGAADGEAVPRIDESGRFYSPLVRSIAAREGVSAAELRAIGGSGRDGRVTKQDLMDYVENRGSRTSRPRPEAPSASPKSDPATTAELTSTLSDDGRIEIVEMDRMRRIIADHMVTSKRTSAHVTSFAEADVTNLVKLREAEKDEFLEREGIKLTFTPFFVKAAVDALRDHPLLNASVDGDKILIKKDFHVGIAVAIGKTGLVVPVIRTAGQKNIAGLARDASILAERARARQLQPDDLQGGTFTVTNIGSLGSIMGTPIILQPQVAILATGAIKKRAVVVEDPELGDIIAVRHMMYVSLSYDHRIIDGAMSASFLHSFTQNVQTFKPGVEL